MRGKLLYVASTQSHIRTFHLPYLHALEQDGWEVHGAWGKVTDEIPYVTQTLSLPFEKKMLAAGNLKAARILRKKIKSEQYHTVIVHTSLAAFFTRLAVLGLKKRPYIINMVHGYLFDDQTGWLKRQIMLGAERVTAPVTDLVVTMNRWDHRTAEKYRLGKAVCHVPGVGVDFAKLEEQRTIGRDTLRRKLGISEDAFVLIYPAEFSQRKSQQVLLRALTHLPENVVLVLPGSGALLENCKETAHALGVAHKVRFPGYIDQMGSWYSMADAAVSSSRSEGLPFNIMEAMHCGLPVVASAVKGHEDLIEHEKNGLLYPYGDETACAEQIQKVMLHPELVASISTQGKMQIQKYALTQVLPQVLTAYNFILHKSGPPV